MPQYEYRCPSGHVTTLVLPISQHREKTKCKECGKQAEQFLSRPAFFGSGRLIWTGEQAWGKKKLLSDEHRADAEADMVSDSLSTEEMTRHAFD